MSGTSFGYMNGSTFVAFRGDSTATYTYVANSTGGTVDMGARNNYRYVNAANVYTKGKVDGVTVHTKTYTPTSRAANLDLGASHTYRYVTTTSVPNANSGTYTYAANSTGGTIDLGATNTYRYVNAANVYAKGKADAGGDKKHTVYVYAKASSSGSNDYLSEAYVMVDGVVKAYFNGNKTGEATLTV